MKIPKVAIIHEWFINYAGSEKVVQQILKVYPEADLMALLEFLPPEKKENIQHKKVRTSFLQYFPFSKAKYRYYLPLMPMAVGRMSAPAANIIISSSHAVAKGLKRSSNQLHICYCHTPVRYAWDLHDEYLKSTGLNKGLKSILVKSLLKYIRKWDLKSASNVSHFIANSSYVAQRIKNIYKREATVIYPPVDTHYFTLQTQKADFYLTAARMVPYKKVNLIVDTFANFPDKKLIVIGDGPDLNKIKSNASPNVKFLGYQSPEMLKQYMQRAKAFIFAADEDFGITSIEAQACGTPVLAYKKGGNLETVVENKTGLFFNDQTIASLKECIQHFEKNQSQFLPQEIRKHAEKFGEERFRKEFKNFVDKKYLEFVIPPK
jgi:glycosyltransferase involved in cell wall biosynthesis